MVFKLEQSSKSGIVGKCIDLFFTIKLILTNIAMCLDYDNNLNCIKKEDNMNSIKKIVFAGIGAALAATIKIGQREEFINQRLIVILPSFGERYLSTAMFESNTVIKARKDGYL